MTDGLQPTPARYSLYEGYDTCENCYESMEKGSGELITFTDHMGRERTYNACRYCRMPVQLTIYFVSGQYWICYSEGVGQFYVAIDAYGDTKEAVIQDFKQKYAFAFDRDLVRFNIKTL